MIGLFMCLLLGWLIAWSSLKNIDVEERWWFWVGVACLCFSGTLLSHYLIFLPPDGFLSYAGRRSLYKGLFATLCCLGYGLFLLLRR